MAKKHFYAVAVGRQPGIYSSWPEAEAQVKGYQGAKYKGFPTRDEAAAWLQSAGGETPPGRAADRGAPARPAAPPQTRSFFEPPSGPVPEAPRRIAESPQAQYDPHAAALAAGQAVLYTDGGADPNPGPGGYGAVLIDGAKRVEVSGGFRLTTNNRMELMAVIEGLAALPADRPVTVYSDSRYLVRAVQKGWAQRWRRNDWTKKDGTPRENADLWGRLLDLLEHRQAGFQWVPGHAGVPENERCDRLATEAARRPDLPPDPGYENPPRPPTLFDDPPGGAP